MAAAAATGAACSRPGVVASPGRMGAAAAGGGLAMEVDLLRAADGDGQADGLCPPLSEAVRGVPMRLLGPHQARNAGLAASAALLLSERGWRVTDAALAAGLSAAWLPARFEVVSRQHAESGGGGGGDRADWGGWTVADGAHSPSAAAAAADTLRAVFPAARFPKIGLVLAMAADKDAVAVLRPLVALRPSFVAVTQVPVAGSALRSAPPGALAAAWATASGGEGEGGGGADAVEAGSLAEALRAARAAVGPGGVVLVTGSLYAAAAARVAPASQAA